MNAIKSQLHPVWDTTQAHFQNKDKWLANTWYSICYMSLFLRLFISFQLNFYAVQWLALGPQDRRMVFFLQQGKTFFSPPKLPNRLWDLPNFIFNG